MFDISNNILPHFVDIFVRLAQFVLSDLAGCQLLLLADHVVGGVVDAAAAEHEAVHTHAEVLALSLQTLPDKHAGALQGTVSTDPARHSLTHLNP